MSKLSILLRYQDYIRYSSRITVSTRYSNTYLGIFWHFLDPLLMMFVYAFIYLVVFQSRTEDYLVFLLTGLIVWRWIAGSVTQSSNSISSRQGILEQVAAPKQIFPMVNLLVETVLFFAACILILGALIIDNIQLTWHVVEFIPITIVTFIFLYGFGLIVAHFGAFIADLKPALSYFLRFLFYLSPIFYEIALLPENIQKYYYYNPITIIVEGFRGVLIYGSSPDYLGLLAVLTLGLAAMWAGWRLIDVHDKDYGKLK